MLFHVTSGRNWGGAPVWKARTETGASGATRNVVAAIALQRLMVRAYAVGKADVAVRASWHGGIGGVEVTTRGVLSDWFRISPHECR